VSLRKEGDRGEHKKPGNSQKPNKTTWFVVLLVLICLSSAAFYCLVCTAGSGFLKVLLAS
jgi:hypothetical protein